MKRNTLNWGTSGDAIFLMFIKLVTIVLGFTVTRLLSQYLSVYDYGTYSQILLVVSTVTSLTILGMMDGVNFFYGTQPDPRERETYISTVFALQFLVTTAAGCVVMLLSAPLCVYFDNPRIGKLLIFAAILPLLQNLLNMFQVLLVSVGKARLLAVRNLIVSLARLGAVLLVILLVRDIRVILVTTLVLDAGQILLFRWILRGSGCCLRLKSVDMRRVGTILRYCAPMGVFTAISALNRDCDKYLIALMTDTQTLAVYANASKILPFDIVMSSFSTVLIPHITRRVAQGDKAGAEKLYRLFLEIALLSTGILCCAALAAAPQLMDLLYTEKYAQGLPVFCIYILVDLLRFTNITLVLSAAGKTARLMCYSLGALVMNAALNYVFYHWMGICGPAVATLVTTLVMGLLIMGSGAKVLQTSLRNLFDWKNLGIFLLESLALLGGLYGLRSWLDGLGVPYFVVLLLICGIYGGAMLLLQGKRLLYALKQVNRTSGT